MTEYRVSWKRFGIAKRERKYQRRHSAERLYAWLLSDEPWEVFGKKATDYFCCSGSGCGCGGLTVAEQHAESNASKRPLEYVRFESREVGEWGLLSIEVETPSDPAELSPEDMDELRAL